jgi:signal transduction histidine kinase
VRRIVIGKRLGDVGVTSTETRPSLWDRLSPRNWSLAWKLVAVGLVPALLAIVLGVLRVADQAGTASDLGAANRLLEVRGEVAATASALRDERDRATLFLAERRLGDRDPLQEVIARTDGAIEQVRTATAAADGLDEATRSALEQAEGGFGQLSVLRADVTGSAALTTAEAVQRYSAVVERTDVLDRALLRQVRTPETAGLADALTAVTSASEALALQHTVLGAALRTGTVTPEDRAVISRTDGDFVSAFTEYQVALPPSLEPVNFITSGANAEREAAKSAILAAPDPGPISVTAEAWDDATTRTAEQVDAATAAVTTGLVDAGAAAEDRSSNLAGVNSVILMLGLLLAATIILLVTRTLTRSLRVLRSSALDVAQRRLPQAVESMRSGGTPDVTAEPVPLRTRDEVGQVARAFDAVHGQALRLAADQAALQSNVSSMFVNLSRRSQALVERQLQLIEQLESNEQDPDQLSNLFQLDHLATRMRRNSENLLVLAGTDLAKRNVAAVPLVDALRAAVSEIEQYQRIVVQPPPPSTVVGRATSDVVHLLAELLDNATNFSPPDSQVVMSSMRNPDGSITVEIADRGVGMNELELDDANRRLTTPSAVEVSTSRRMGLFVVGRLAARHGIAVNLGGAPMGGPGGGLTASVTLPAHLVTTTGGDGWTMPPAAQPAVGPNGTASPRPARMLRPGSAVVPSGREDAAQRIGAAAVNGLPTRTPGSSLRPAVAAAPVHAPGADEAGAAEELADDQALTAPVPETPPAPTPEAADDAHPAVTEADAAESDGAALDTADPHRDAADEAEPFRANTADAARTADDIPDSTADEPTGQVAIAHADEPTGEGTTEDAEAQAEQVEEERDEVDTTGEAGEAGDDAPTEHIPQDRVGGVADAGTGEPIRPNGAYRGQPVPPVPYEVADQGQGDTGQNGTRQDGTGQVHTDEDADAGLTPHTTPLPALNGEQREEADIADDGEALFSPIVPAGAESLPRARRSVADIRRGSLIDPNETTPIFEEIASAWFAENRPVPVDWELGERQETEADAAGAAPVEQVPAKSVWTAPPDSARRDEPSVEPRVEAHAGSRTDARAESPTDARAESPTDARAESPTDARAESPTDARAESPTEARVESRTDARAESRTDARAESRTDARAESRQPADEDFASVADEGWRAASGAAADRPDELTAAGLPKRRPRARLVPGSAGSAVLAATAGSSRSAETTRARLASYQQGVRQGREVRLRRDPAGSGLEQDVDGENGAAPTGGDHDEESR